MYLGLLNLGAPIGVFIIDDEPAGHEQRVGAI